MKDRNINIDIIKSLCAIFVIVTHLISDELSRVVLSRYWIDLAVPAFLIITGYNFRNSCERNKFERISDWFNLKNFAKKFSRIFIPFLYSVATLVIIQIVFRRFDVTLFIDQLKYFQLGPGCYYICILLQILILFPLMYYSQKKYGAWTSLVFIIIQIYFEYTANKFWLSPSLYQLISLRYIIFIAAGINLDFLINKIKNFVWIAIFGIGVVYIYKYNYSGFEPFMFRLWTLTSMPTVLYCLPLIVLFMRFKINWASNIFGRIFGTIGQASYHIFLVQMVYFAIGITYNIYRDVSLCVLAGICFFYFDKLIRNTLSKNCIKCIS